MRRALGSLVLAFALLSPGSVLASVLGFDPCAPTHHAEEETSDESCPPACIDCACCAPLRPCCPSGVVLVPAPTESKGLPLPAALLVPPAAPTGDIFHVPRG